MNGHRYWLFFAFAAAVACGDSGDTTGGGAAHSKATYGDPSTCKQCDIEMCAESYGACTADAGCTAYLGCLDGCELATSGDASAACEESCAAQQGGAPLVEAFRTCRTQGAGTACTVCGRAPDGGGGAGGAPPTCGGDWSFPQMCAPDPTIDDECIRCHYEKCCDTIDPVFNDPGPTKDLADCWLDCDTTACEADCFAMYPEGIPGFAEYEACFFTQCGEPDGPCELTGTCNECWYDECECEFLDCKNDPECYLTFACYGQCTSSECIEACVAEHPTAATTFNTLQTCILQRCGSQCGNGG